MHLNIVLVLFLHIMPHETECYIKKALVPINNIESSTSINTLSSFRDRSKRDALWYCPVRNSVCPYQYTSSTAPKKKINNKHMINKCSK